MFHTLCRRMGIALELVTRLEQWFSEMGVEYAYIATAKDNEASVGLFTGKCSYTVFRTLSVLVHPVFRHHIKIPRQVVITKLNSCRAEELYRLHFSTTDFFPRDINSVLNNPLCLGTFLAFNPKEQGGGGELRKSWAVVSIWNCMEVLRFELKGVSKMKRGFEDTVGWNVSVVEDTVLPQLVRTFRMSFLVRNWRRRSPGGGSAHGALHPCP